MTSPNPNLPVVAWIYADTEHSVLGTPSRLNKLLGQHTVLNLTCRRIAAIETIDNIVIFCPQNQCEPIRRCAGITNKPIEVVGLEAATLPGRRLIHRKWSNGCWRGGINESVWIDEGFLMPEMINFALKRNQERIAFFPPDAVLLDSTLANSIIDLYLNNENEMRICFSQAAVGLACICARIDMLCELHQANASVSDLLGYLPDTPHSDYIMQDCCFKVPSPLFRTPYRYLTDTERSWRIIQRIFQEQDTETIMRWSAIDSIEAFKEFQTDYYGFPREVEIELNTLPSHRIVGYPHGSIDRPSLPLKYFEKLLDDCSEHDDICLTLGGFGEPTGHPDLITMIHMAREKGIFGIHIETDGMNLSDEILQALVDASPDVISVYLDAHSPEGYRLVKGCDGFEKVTHAIQTMVARRRERSSFSPLIIPHMVKTRQTMTEMEAFYDYWKKKCNAAVIEGYNDFAGQIEDRSVMDMTPPRRRYCRRLDYRLTILSDGRVVPCSQDFQGHHPCGHIMEQTLDEIWNGITLTDLRHQQHNENYETNNLCLHCSEWHRA